MPQVSFFKPVDPPQGANRFIEEIRSCLQASEYNRFYFAVAFAKVGPLLRLVEELERWREDEKQIEGIFGIDLKGTSLQALEFAMTIFNKVYVTHNPLIITFHPKIYLFKGDDVARAYIGSQNLTVGGTELNFEGGVRVEIDLSEENAVWQDAYYTWDCLLPGKCGSTIELTEELLKQLIDGGYLANEMERKPGGASAPKPKGGTPSDSIFPNIPPAPPSAIKLPKKYKKKPSKAKAKPPKIAPATQPLANEVTSTYQSLAIQIKPHHNGEIFLSKIAFDQSPEFFGAPFTGSSTPKKSSNKSYPTRDPAPSVTLTLYDAKGAIEHHEDIPSLTMVHYEKKSDIRITINPSVAAKIPNYSIMVMTRTPATSPLDYELHVYFPGSEIFDSYLTQCNLTMPKGNSPEARKMGWL